jgi:2-(1,2-epoxy-1,2-dihydrophenyl)acetyl-CoA isomerase
MTDPLDQFAVTETMHAVRTLYDAFARQDATALLAALAPDFHGVVADGMPAGLGGNYDGPEPMLRDCWARVFALADVRPVPTEYLPVAADRVVVIGYYDGTARATGRPLCAAFAHIVRVFADRISELVQITDTARWHDALALQEQPSDGTAT